MLEKLSTFARRKVGTTYVIEFPTTIMYWHVAAFSNIFTVCEQLTHEILQAKSSLLEDPSLPVLRKHNVLREKSGSRTHGNTFFACRDLVI